MSDANILPPVGGVVAVDNTSVARSARVESALAADHLDDPLGREQLDDPLEEKRRADDAPTQTGTEGGDEGDGDGEGEGDGGGDGDGEGDGGGDDDESKDKGDGGGRSAGTAAKAEGGATDGATPPSGDDDGGGAAWSPASTVAVAALAPAIGLAAPAAVPAMMAGPAVSFVLPGMLALPPGLNPLSIGLTPSVASHHRQVLDASLATLSNKFADIRSQLNPDAEAAKANVQSAGAGMDESTVASGNAAVSKLESSYQWASTKTGDRLSGLQKQAFEMRQQRITAVNKTAVAECDKATEAFNGTRQAMFDEKAVWEGSYQETTATQAKAVLELGELYATECENLAAKAKAEAEVFGASNSPPDALEQARSKAMAAHYKGYADEYRKYALMASQWLTEAAKQGTLLSDGLMAPSIEEIPALQEANTGAIEAEREALEKRISGEVDMFAEGLDASRSLQLDLLSQEQGEVVGFFDQSVQVLQDHTSVATDAVALHFDEVQGQVDLNYSEMAQDIQSFLESRPLVPDGDLASNLVDNVVAELDAGQAEVSDTLAADADMLVADLQDQHDVRLDEIETGAEDQSGKVVTRTEDVVDAAEGALDQVEEQVDTAVDATTSTMTAAGDDVDGRNKASSESIVAQAEANKDEVVAALEEYEVQVGMNLELLQLRMNEGAVSVGDTAVSAEKTDLEDRASKAYEAIDGMGTYEDDLMESLLGISVAESAYIQDNFKGLTSGETLKDWIIDDTSEGDGVRESCFASLAGNAVLGAKLAMKWGQQQSGMFFNADADLINKAMGSLDEENRQLLIEDPEFPELQAEISETLRDESVNSIFGANIYEVQTFEALSDAEADYDEAHGRADAIELVQAFKGTANPLTWGTDEAKIWEVMGKQDDKQRKALLLYFEAYYGDSLDNAMSGELSGLELDRGQALVDGDKEKADAYGIEYALQEGHEQDAFDLLDDADRQSDDWRTKRNADAKHDKTGAAYSAHTGSTVEADIDKHLDDGNGEQQIAQGMWAGEQDQLAVDGDGNQTADAEATIANTSDPRWMLLYSIKGGGTYEKYAQKAADMIKAELKARDTDEAKIAYLGSLQSWFAEKGYPEIWDYLGIGSQLYSPEGKELDGKERYDFHMALMEGMSDDTDVDDQYAIAKTTADWYLGRGSGKDKTANMFTNSDEHLMELWTKVSDMYSDKSWFHQGTDKAAGTVKGQVKEDKASQAKWAEFKKTTGLLKQMSTIFDSRRGGIVDKIAMGILVMVALVTTVVSAGTLGLAWAAVLGGFMGSMAAIGIKKDMLGANYGPDQALIDFGIALGEAALDVATMGLARVLKGAKFLKELAKAKGWKAGAGKIIANAAESLPSELATPLMNEEIWEKDGDLGAAFAQFGMRLVFGSAAKDLGPESFKNLVGKKASPYVKIFYEKLRDNALDFESWDQDAEDFLWKVAKGTFQGFLSHEGKVEARRRIADNINANGAFNPLQLQNAQDLGAEDFEPIFVQLDPKMQNWLRTNEPSLVPDAMKDAVTSAGQQAPADMGQAGPSSGKTN